MAMLSTFGLGGSTRHQHSLAAKFPELFGHRDRRSLDKPPSSVEKTGVQFLIKNLFDTQFFDQQLLLVAVTTVCCFSRSEAVVPIIF